MEESGAVADALGEISGIDNAQTNQSDNTITGLETGVRETVRTNFDVRVSWGSG
jgi:hypothetical protein